MYGYSTELQVHIYGMVHQDIKKQMGKQKCMTYIVSFYFIYLWTYAFDVGRYITRTSGRGLGPGNQDFLGPVKCHRAVRQVPQE
jgi:hypothetical protein